MFNLAPDKPRNEHRLGHNVSAHRVLGICYIHSGDNVCRREPKRRIREGLPGAHAVIREQLMNVLGMGRKTALATHRLPKPNTTFLGSVPSTSSADMCKYRSGLN